MTEDGNLRHKLLPNNRYDEARANKESVYKGKLSSNRKSY
ncbi:Atu4866 domain-containing protein [Cellulophaga baltica]|nr:Atu4866 domain-containing protein [Cellulophaga baltica]